LPVGDLYAWGGGATPLFDQPVGELKHVDVILDIQRADARHAGGVKDAGVLIGMYESGCWKKLFDCGV
jgi:hypothetical protein